MARTVTWITDVRNRNSLRQYTVTHTLLNSMEGSHSILLIPHPEFNPHTAWPRATVSAFHYSSPSNSAFKAEPRAAHLLQQWKQSFLLLPLTWSLLLLEVMEGEWPNPQAIGDEEGIKMPHYSQNYSFTNPTHKGLIHVMTSGIITPCLLSVPIFYNTGRGTSYHCQRE